jgi:UDP-GlcNAc:undecaprenyl-phosphate/decaprenyl-phosphate GlcNAc-1-phosphate transferase
MLNNFIIEIFIVFVVSLLLSLVIIIWFAHSKSKFIKRNDITAVQASHVKSVARIGGLSIVAALVISVIPFLEIANIRPNYLLLLLSSFPVFLVGFCEDLGFFSSPRVRLLAAIFSGAVFVGLSGQWLPRTDIPGLDFAIQWAPIGIGFSIFLAAGVSHAFNLIDGVNGLSGFVAVGISLSLAAISHQMGLDEHRDVLFILSSAIAGFLVFNFPFGKIFLGDGGAYVIGHILVWMAISILYAAPNITPLAMLLIFFYPVADTLLAITRRVYLGVPIVHPDRMHFHQLVMRGIEIVVLGRKRRHIANPLASALILPLAFTPMVVGIFLVLDRGKAIIALLLFTALFLMAYKICMRLISRFRSYK